MAALKHLRTGADIPLAARHVVGRSRTCQLQIDAASVSAIHAELTWDGSQWRLRDLGSRNGTFIAGRKIPPGQEVVLARDSDVGFGAAEAQYRLVDVAPPHLIAFGRDEILVAEANMLCLPSSTECEAVILRDGDDRWVIESPEGTRPLADEEYVVVRGRPYFVHLPGGVSATRDAEQQRDEPVDDGVLEFRVSRDGEHVDLRLRQGDRIRVIESRAHTFLLLALARARLADTALAEVPESEQGWMYREDLMKELAIEDPQLLNLWVCRARQQFAQMKLREASRLIERREAAGQLRFGVQRLCVIDA